MVLAQTQGVKIALGEEVMFSSSLQVIIILLMRNVATGRSLLGYACDRPRSFLPLWSPFRPFQTDCDRSKMSFSILPSPGPGCSNLTTSLVNVSLKFQTLISEIWQYFLLKK